MHRKSSRKTNFEDGILPRHSGHRTPRLSSVGICTADTKSSVPILLWHQHNGSMDAVGTIITDRPPHRSVRALLRIRLPPWMRGEKADYRISMQNAWGWKPPLEDREKLIPRHSSLTTSA